MNPTQMQGYCPVEKTHTNLPAKSFRRFTMIKFRHGKYVLPAATMTPHAIFGVSNLWVNRKIPYFCADINNEKLILTGECIEKLYHQNHTITNIKPIDVSGLCGAEADVPGSDRKIPIINADFVIPNLGSGIVMSVPAHSIFDYIAWCEIGNTDAPGYTASISGYGTAPAKELYECFLGAKYTDGFDASQHFSSDEVNEIRNCDMDIADISRKLYDDEFRDGRLNEKCAPFAGRRIRYVTGTLHNFLVKQGFAEAFYETNEGVKCKCGSELIPATDIS